MNPLLINLPVGKSLLLHWELIVQMGKREIIGHCRGSLQKQGSGLVCMPFDGVSLEAFSER